MKKKIFQKLVNIEEDSWAKRLDSNLEVYFLRFFYLNFFKHLYKLIK